MIKTIACEIKSDYDKAKVVVKDYIKWLNVDLKFQNIDSEMISFDEMYGGNTGAFVLIQNAETVLGGVGIRKLSDEICEIKRMFIYNEYRGKGYGILLGKAAITVGKELGYTFMRLDTIKRLVAANRLYEKLGFSDIAAYRENPDPTARYMEVKL